MPSYELQKLRQEHQEILRLTVAGLGATEVAEALGITPATVHNVVGSAVSQGLLSAMHAARTGAAVDVGAALTAAAPRAFRVVEQAFRTVLGDSLDDLADGRRQLNLTDKEVVDTAFRLLDRAGHGPVRKSEVTHSGIVTARLVGELNEAAKALEPGIVVNAELVDEAVGE